MTKIWQLAQGSATKAENLEVDCVSFISHKMISNNLSWIKISNRESNLSLLTNLLARRVSQERTKVLSSCLSVRQMTICHVERTFGNELSRTLSCRVRFIKRFDDNL